VDGHVHRAEAGDRDGGEAGVRDELLVFGRTEYTEPLTERGVAPKVEEVLEARPESWVELVAFPRSAVHWIIRDGEDAESERPARAGR
jgi:hypothetical protein